MEKRKEKSDLEGWLVAILLLAVLRGLGIAFFNTL